MPGDFFRAGRSLPDYYQAPFFRWDRNLKRQASKLRLTNLLYTFPADVFPGQEPWMLDDTNSLIYNIYLMAGQLREHTVVAPGFHVISRVHMARIDFIRVGAGLCTT